MKKISNLFRVDKQEFIIIFIAFFLLSLFVTLFTSYTFANKLITKETIMNNNNTGLTLLDRNGKPFFTFYQATYKSNIPLSTIPDYVQHAAIASEDKNFYTN